MSESLNLDMYEQLVDGIAEGRELDPARVRSLIDQGPFVPAEAMSRVMRHLHDEHGGAESYMRSVGLEDEQIESLRSGLLDE